MHPRADNGVSMSARICLIYCMQHIHRLPITCYPVPKCVIQAQQRVISTAKISSSSKNVVNSFIKPFSDCIMLSTAKWELYDAKKYKPGSSTCVTIMENQVLLTDTQALT